MSRKNRINEEGFYHIINRGVEKRNVFLEPDDYDMFLTLLVEIKKQFNIVIHVYVLMTNHYHLLLETKQNNISKSIQFLNDKYSKYFNKKYQRVGHLWQGRFKSYYLYDDTHFWIVAKYIERNPIKANMVLDINGYKHQSYFQWRNKSDYYALLTDSMIFHMTLVEYEEYISTDLQLDALEQIYVSPKVISVDGKMQFLTRRLETFFDEDKDVNRRENAKSAFEYGYAVSEIASYLALSHTTVSKYLKKG
ncbi:MAG: transposase [Sulfuricurvum sp.]|nr:transposase [Sulfuricurvum sp.]